jgi:hypothetical protein
MAQKLTPKQIDALEGYHGKRTFKLLRESPYDFRFSFGRNNPPDLCKINGKVCKFFTTYKSGAYSAMKIYNISYKEKVVFSSTSLKEIFSMIETAQLLFKK